MLLELFPNSRNPIIIRHPLDTFSSMLLAWNPQVVDRLEKQPPARQRISQLAKMYLNRWATQNEILQEYARQFPQNFLLLKHEDLNLDVCQEIFDFTNLAAANNLSTILNKKVGHTRAHPRASLLEDYWQDRQAEWSQVAPLAEQFGYQYLN